MRSPLVGLLLVALPLLVDLVSTAHAREPAVSPLVPCVVDSAQAELAEGVRDPARAKLAPMLLKLTHVETDPEYTRLAATLDTASRTAFSGIPGVTVLGDGDDEVALAKKTRKPVVVLSAKLQNLATSKQGDEVEFRAQVQYVIYRIPNRDIAAVLEGGAKTRIAARQVKSKESRQQVEDDVAAAAVESAARRAPAALMAITKK